MMSPVKEQAGKTKASLSQAVTSAMLRVEDMERAKNFYREKLGLEVQDSWGPTAQAFVVTGEGTGFGLYERPGTPAPQNTTLSFKVDDFDSAFEELKSRGVEFEEYDIPEIGLKTQDGVAEIDGNKVAWFTDSEDNIMLIAETW